MAGIPAVIEEDDGTTTICYYREPNGALIARRVGATGSTWRYYHFDGLGSTIALTDGNGDVTDTYTYDLLGCTEHTTGTTNQPYQFGGRQGGYSHYQAANFDKQLQGRKLRDSKTGKSGRSKTPYPKPDQWQMEKNKCIEACETNRNLVYRQKFGGGNSAVSAGSSGVVSSCASLLSKLCPKILTPIAAVTAVGSVNSGMDAIQESWRHNYYVGDACEAFCQTKMDQWKKRHGEDPYHPWPPPAYKETDFNYWWANTWDRANSHVGPFGPPGEQCRDMTDEEKWMIIHTILPNRSFPPGTNPNDVMKGLANGTIRAD